MIKKVFKKSLLPILTLILPATLFAVNADDIKVKIEATNSQVKAIEQEIASYNEKLKQTRGEKSTLKNAITTLDINKLIVTKDLTLTEKKIEGANQSIEELDQNIGDLGIKLSDNQAYLRKSLQEMSYNDNYDSKNLLHIILSSNSISDAFDRAAELENFQRGVLYRMQAIQEDKTSLEKAQVEKAGQRNELLTLNQELVAKRKIIDQTKREKDQLLKTTNNKESAFQAELKKRLETKNKLEQEMLDYEEQLRVTIDPSSLPKTGSGVLSYPLSKVLITQYFGNTAFASKNAQIYNGKGHNGVDFSARIGTRVMSVLSGTVQDFGNTDDACRGASYGKWVLVRHNNGLSSLYAHLSTIDVVVGQSVGTGDLIGLSGNTGYSTGPHLHFTLFASKAVTVINRQSRACGTIMKIPVSPQNGYLNPLSYF